MSQSVEISFTPEDASDDGTSRWFGRNGGRAKHGRGGSTVASRTIVEVEEDDDDESYPPSRGGLCHRTGIVTAAFLVAAMLVLAGGIVLGLSSKNGDGGSSKTSSAMKALDGGGVTMEQCKEKFPDEDTWMRKKDDDDADVGGDNAKDDGRALRLGTGRRTATEHTSGFLGAAGERKEEEGVYLVSIGTDNNSISAHNNGSHHHKKHHCSGSLVRKDVILTAAHCFTDNRNNGQFKLLEWVEFNRVDMEENDNVVRAYIARDDVVRHPMFDWTTLDYDYALIFLDDVSNTLNLDHHRTIALNGDATVPADGKEELEALGWGMTSDNPTDVPRLARSVAMDYVTNEDCTQDPYEWDDGRITERMLCAYNEDEKVCNLDSGAPIIKHTDSGPLQIGITSFVAKINNECIIKDYPHVYSRVSAELGWIKKTVCSRTQQWCPTSSPTPRPSSSHVPSSISSKSSKSSSSKSGKGCSSSSTSSEGSGSKSGKSSCDSSKSESSSSEGGKSTEGVTLEQCQAMWSKEGSAKSSKGSGGYDSAKSSKSSRSNVSSAKSDKSDHGSSSKSRKDNSSKDSSDKEGTKSNNGR